MALKEDPHISRIIHHMCLMMDELEEKIKTQTPVRMDDLIEIQTKSEQLRQMAVELTQFSQP